GNEILGSCYVSRNPEIICTEEYDPVCACNNLVYGNSCEAEKAGNLKWKSSEKDSREACSY
ncbi:MAG: Kazal-type serine protease inhibitor, partial [Flavobacteriaceae bacterium]|nr:Kazal-type serine protease inhibitor [Flavobacteriaceae bacterium]